MATGTSDYEVLTHDGPFELRRYAGYLTANVRISAASYGQAMNAGFNPLADYIFGNNRAADRISMTVPVTAGRACCQKIAMTAPVTAQHTEDEYVVSFTMPSEYTAETLPQPNNPAVTIEQVTQPTLLLWSDSAATSPEARQLRLKRSWNPGSASRVSVPSVTRLRRSTTLRGSRGSLVETRS